MILKTGSRRNTIGKEGPFVIYEHPHYGTLRYRPYNLFIRSEIGMVVEGGDENIIQNNRFGVTDSLGVAPNKIGLHLIGGKDILSNQFGGPSPELGNLFESNTEAGILIEVDGREASPGGWFRNNRIRFSGLFAGPQNVDVRHVVPKGIGLWIRKSLNVKIEHPFEQSNFFENNNLGIYLDDAQRCQVGGMHLVKNKIAGIVVSGGLENVIGSEISNHGNTLSGNGRATELREGGIMIVRGGNHKLIQNKVGPVTGKDSEKNKGDGIYIFESTNNRIGSDTKSLANRISGNQGAGIRIEGSGSQRNRIAGNIIGADEADLTFAADPGKLGNDGSGITLEGGASNNIIGSLTEVSTDSNQVLNSESTNEIIGNGGFGIQLLGGAGNTILSNGISANSGNGIELSGGANPSAPKQVPSFEYTEGGGVSSTPGSQLLPGTIIQLFSNPEGGQTQGSSFLGEAEVNSEGQWSIPAILPRKSKGLSMTLTHPLTQETSSLLRIDTNPRVEVASSTGPGANPETIRPQGGQFRGLSFEITSQEGKALVKSIKVTASGEILNSPSQKIIGWLYRDIDGDGEVTQADLLISGPQDLSSSEGVSFFNFELDGYNLDPEETQEWIVCIEVSESVEQSQINNLVFSLDNPTSVSTEFVIPSLPESNADGIFPIASSTFSLGNPSAGYIDWAKIHFGPNAQQNPEAGMTRDPDGDGLLNFGEFVFDGNPLLAEPNDGQLKVAMEGKRLVVQIKRHPFADALNFTPITSINVAFENTISSFFNEPEILLEGGSQFLKYISKGNLDAQPSLFIKIVVNE